MLTLVFVSQPARGESYQPREVHHQPQDPTPPTPSRNKDSFSQGPPIDFLFCRKGPQAFIQLNLIHCYPKDPWEFGWTTGCFYFKKLRYL